jgi:hypothetical protein
VERPIVPPALQLHARLVEAIKKRQVDANPKFYHSFIVAKKGTIHYKTPTLIFFRKGVSKSEHFNFWP